MSDPRAAGPRRPSRSSPIPPWRDVRVLGIAAQLLAVLLVLVVGWFLFANLIGAMASRGLFPSFTFLGLTAGFDIGESLIGYEFTDTYGHALFVGLVNTLLVSVLGIVGATVIGLVFGVGRLSRNWLVAKIALGYIELFRNTPLLLQLFVIYFVVFLQLPRVEEAFALPGDVFISQRGIYFPRPIASPTADVWTTLLAAGALVAMAAWWIAGRLEADGRPSRRLRPVGLLVGVGLPLVGWLLLARPPFDADVPVLGNFNFAGGASLSPEFGALLVGLVLYTGAFIAEIVRGGIQAIDRGQLEAARAIGLRERQTLRLVVLPQALRIIVPPLTSQYLNLVKNSSLAIAIGYSDLFNVSNTISNQTGQPIAVIVVVMAVYLVLSLVTSVAMNLYNRRVQLVSR